MVACENCKYWQQFDKTTQDDTKGECRRFPPVTDDVGSFPVTKGKDWCGEYRMFGF